MEYDDSFGVIEFYGEDGSVIIACSPKSKDGVLYVHAFLTPEQAVEATLGRGTCKDSNRRFNAWVCSECAATVLLMFDDYDEPSYSVDGVADVPHYCPNCGRKVVDA